MAFIDDFHFRPLQSQLEQSDYAIPRKLCGYGSAAHSRKLLFDPPYVLRSLNDADLVLAAFGLHRDDVMAAVLVETDLYNSSISICPMPLTVVRRWFWRLYVVRPRKVSMSRLYRTMARSACSSSSA